jgi:PAS domain S-box-containing protein
MRATTKQLSGALFGGICVIGMMLPIEVTPGVIFDPRSVVLSMAGLFGGPIVALISAAITGGYRMWLGGGGVYVGVGVVIASSVLGLAYRYASQKAWLKVGVPQLLVFGLIVHLVEVLLLTQLPDGVVQKVMDTVALPLILTFTPATAFLGVLLKDIENRIQTESELVASESRLSLHLENTPLAAITWDENFRCTLWNKAAQEIFGYTVDEAQGKHAMELVMHEGIHDELLDRFNLLLTQHGGTRRVNENKTKDGRTITNVRRVCKALFHDRQEYVYLLSSVQFGDSHPPMLTEVPYISIIDQTGHCPSSRFEFVPH